MEQKDKLGTKRACITCGREFDWDTTVCPDDNTPLTALGEEDQLVGTVLAERYEILEVIGGGGMGLVYKARHKLMNRIVAIKMLHKHMISSKDTLKRFQLEAQAASCLSLPNILTVYDFGLTSEGQPYMVMDYLEGTSLADVLEQEHHVVPDRAVNIFIQACAGLAHAHQKGVLHRDIKPSNIMLVNFGDQADFVKIVDFGIAKLLNQGVGELTKTGEVYGSPSYMSPEQCRGKETDARSDIYSMGCVMYRTLSGRPLFSGDDIIELLFKQVSEPPAPFDADLNIPADLEAVIFKALAKDPADRYQTMGEFKESLEKYQEKRSGKATPTPTVEGPMPLWKRHGEAPNGGTAAKGKAVPAAAAGAVPAAPNGPSASPSDAPPAVNESASPVLPPSAKADSARQSEPPRARPAEPSSAPPPQVQTPAPPPSPQPVRDEAARPGRNSSPLLTPPDTKHGASSQLRKKMAGPNKVVIIAAAAVAVIAIGAGGFFALKNSQNGGSSQTASTSTTTETQEAHLSDANAQIAFMSGRESFKNKKYDDARVELEEALDLTEKSAGMNSRELVPVLSQLALVYRKLDKMNLAENSLKRAIPVEEHANGKGNVTLADLHFQLAQVLHESGKPKDADASARKALAIRKSVNPDAPQVSEIQGFIASNLPSKSTGEEKPTSTAIVPPAVITPPPAKVVTPPTAPAKTEPSIAATDTGSKTEHPTTTASKPDTVEPPSATPPAATAQKSSAPTKRPRARKPHHASSSTPAPSPVRHRRAYSSYGF